MRALTDIIDPVSSDLIGQKASAIHCYNLTYTGCHDGCVYTMCAETGTTHWCFKSGEESCNSSPCVDPDTGLVWIGSHDQHIYAIDIQVYIPTVCLPAKHIAQRNVI